MSASHEAAGASAGFNLSEWALRQKTLVVFLMLVTMLLGVFSYERLTRNEDPPFTIKTMVVSAYWPGATTEDTANLLTDRLEQKLEETPHLDRVESYSRNGQAVVFVHLRDDAPPEAVPDAWYQVRKKIADIRATLPAGVQGPFFDDEFGDTYGTVYGLVPDGFTKREARDRLEDVRAELLRIPNVGKVRLLGVQEEQIRVAFSPAKLAAYGIDADAAVRLLRSQNDVAPAGTIRLPREEVAIRVTGAFASDESVRRLTLPIGGRFVPLTDLATVTRETVNPPAPLFRVNGQDALGIAISMAPQGNLLEFGAAVRATMDDVAKRLPHGLELVKVADQSVVVQDAVKGFLKVLVEAVLIVLAVSFLSLGTRAGLVVTASIPLVLAMTFVGMDLAGIGLQRISLGALIIALGLLVDDAMITVEAMVSRLELGWSLRRAATYAWESTAFPMLTGTLVMIAGFIPVGFAASSAGEYCYSLFMVVLISLLASWVVAVLFSPLLGTWILPKTMHGHHGEPGRIGRMFRRVLDAAVRAPVRAIAAAVLVLFVAGAGMAKLQQEFFPASDRPELFVNLNLPQSATIDATLERTKQVEALLAGDPNVDHWSTYVGAGAIRFYLPMDVLLDNENLAQFVVVTKGLEERDALRAKLEAAFAKDFADIGTRVMPLELGPPVGWPLKYRVTGPDVGKVRDIAMQLANVVAADARTRDVNLTSGEPQKAVVVAVNQLQAKAVGLSSDDIASVLATTFSGAPVTAVRDGKRLLEVIVQGDAASRHDVAAVGNLQIATPDGKSVPLRQVADIGYGVQEPIIWKRQRQPWITVQADLRGDVQAATVVAGLARSVDELRATLPPGYAIAVGGAVEEAEKGNASVFAVFPVMALVMVALLMVQLRSFSRTAVALLMAPFGLIGVVAAMLPFSVPMGFVAQLGVIALAGMIIRNAVILIEEVDANVAGGKPVNEAVVEAALHRARPILLTACAAILGMVPIATQVFWKPMAFAIIGGLTAATVVTLTVLPCVLLLLLRWEQQPKTIEREA